MNENHDEKGRFAAAQQGAAALTQRGNKMRQASMRTSDPHLAAQQRYLAEKDLRAAARLKVGNPQAADVKAAANALDTKARLTHRASMDIRSPDWVKSANALQASDAARHASVLRSSSVASIKVAVATIKINGR